MQKKYPCWLEFMNQLSEVKLREFLTLLDDKVEKVKSRIDLLKGSFSSEGLSQLTNYNDNVNPLLVQGGMEYGGNFINNNQEQVAIYPYCNSIINHQEMMMLMMNENDWQYNGASSSSSSNGIGSNNMRCALMKYETMMSHNMMLNSQMPYSSPYVAPTILQPKL